MIIFDLCCEQEHHFEGWFASHDDFNQQQGRELVRCPICNSSQVRRIPSASHIAAPRSHPASSPMPNPAQLMRKLTEVILQSSEDVGTRFAEEARRIHYEEVEPRPIRGQASREECADLQEEGIEILHLPLADPDKLN